MKTDEENTREISRLYYDGVNVNEAVKLMQGQNVSSDLVESIYHQLSADAQKMTDRFHYYTYEDGLDNVVSCWTSRYLIAYLNRSLDSVFHSVKIIDLFNDKSM
jgi:hypothetical protein